MKDGRPSVVDGSQVPCPWSKDCERLADVLDGEWISEFELVHDGDVDAQLLQHLRAHLPHCASCRETLKQARRTRELRRGMLREYLARAEQEVPSTVGNIFQAVRAESRQQAKGAPIAQPPHLLPAKSAQTTISDLPFPAPSRRRSFNKALALVAVAAVIILSFGLFSRLAWLRTGTLQSTSNTLSATQTADSGVVLPPAPAPNLSFSSDWSSAVALVAQSGKQQIAVFDPLSGKQRVITSTSCDNAQADAIAHSGKNMLYHCYDGQYTVYRLLTGQAYRLEGGQRSSGGEYNAVWSTNDRYLFAMTPHTLMRVDIAHNKVEHLPYSISATRLLFYYQDNLYFSLVQGGRTQLKRIDLVSGAQQVVVQSTAERPQFWLRPDGQAIYYTSASAGRVGIYAVGIDGGSSYLFSQDQGLVGFDQDNAPMTIRNIQGQWQLVKIDVVTQQVKARIQDIAPGANAIPFENVLLSPYAHYLLTGGQYASNAQRYWLSDLTTGGAQEVFPWSQQANTSTVSSTWLGWSKMQP
ncbi:hypothetical protein KSD_08940 [Ktedonobacter sp. SOSP1-85]|uniref:hypothetical protein n=1 Tax=Ktedonobacter sp. SOSP1-85 TaxID=2778367 RepID=UPI001916BA31|nr:hypothetical protein [Ktedonobacter sp. SOSP1-85]GHO73123.1 hypothetical protein KSD_08940 [Ktedonobacter sp. SOSP1-85]